MDKKKAIEECCLAFKDDRLKAIATLRILLLGSFEDKDKIHLDGLKKELKEKKINVFTLADFSEELEKQGIVIDNYDLVFDYVWKYGLKPVSCPLIIMFAGETSPHSSGFNSEVGSIINNRDIMENAEIYFFKQKDIGNISHGEKYFTNWFEVIDGIDFKRKSHNTIKRRIDYIMKYVIENK